MKTVRLLLIVALGLTLLSACSQAPKSLQEGLEPQFGTASEDRADAVAYDPKRGYSYVAGVFRSNEVDGGGTVFVRRYTKAGDLTWQWREGLSSTAATVNGVVVDATGNTYLGWSLYNTDGNQGATIVKFGPEGRVLYRKDFKKRPDYFADNFNAFEGDAAGNLYLSGTTENDWEIEKWFLRKYNAQGTLVWERLRTYTDYLSGEVKKGSIAAPRNIGVSEDGSLYVAGYDKESFVLTKYSSSGRSLWQRTVPESNGHFVSVGGGGVYLAVNTNSTSSFHSHTVG